MPVCVVFWSWGFVGFKPVLILLLSCYSYLAEPLIKWLVSVAVEDVCLEGCNFPALTLTSMPFETKLIV